MDGNSMFRIWQCLILATLAVGGSCVMFANSLSRVGRLDGNVTATVKADRGVLSCIMTCSDLNAAVSDRCRAFNFHKPGATCEILSSALCDGSDNKTLITTDSSWRYYDLTNDLDEDNAVTFKDKPVCTEFGKCSGKCSRQINQSCTHDEQCLQVAETTQCTAVGSSPGICKCEGSYWAYNSSLCLPEISFKSLKTDWLWKMIVNSMCEVKVTLTISAPLQLRLQIGADYYTGSSYYGIHLGYPNTSSSLIVRDGSSVQVVLTPGLLSGQPQNFTIKWCSAAIRFGKEGEAPFLSWTDTTPITPIRGMGFYTTGYASYIFQQNLVDPYYPYSQERGEIRTNGYHWHTVRITPDGSPVNSITDFTFKCKTLYGFTVRLGKFDGGYSYQIQIGRNYNNQSAIYSQRHNQDVQVVTSSGILSSSVYRDFWIKFVGRTITFGRVGYSATLNWSESIDFSLTHISLYSWRNQYGYFSTDSFPQFHDYPHGAYV
ncbi:uncharacterized protein LOC135208267 [Macrobrachium nipponense]|uniref:uncharacterized protein LOC135208267 n=1 Tax=Macrobrachium nipponense TaxID=159736 RepID=UPI0030C84D17